jgi:HTH-type transcriptional regulator, sugar sensing transcriptional regulator
MQTVQSARVQKEHEARSKQAVFELDSNLLKLNKLVKSTELKEENEYQVKALKDIYSVLTRFKFSKNEVKVYLYLARYGAQKAQKIAESLGVHRTEAYKILRTLENKGVIYRILERPMKFTAVPFEKVLDTEIEKIRQRAHQLEKKKSELLSLWNSLPKASETETEKETLQVLEGKKQISARITEILRLSTKKLNAVVSDRHLIGIYNSPFFEELEALSKKRDMEVKILTEYSTTSMFVLEQVDLSNCDFTFLHLKGQPSYILSDAGYMILLMENEDGKFYAIETNYDSMLKSYGNLFDLLWQSQDRKTLG